LGRLPPCRRLGDRTTCSAEPSPSSSGPDDDIEELARRLSREAAGRSQSSGGASAGPVTWSGVLASFDERRLGEFYPEEFELLEEMGRLGSDGGEPILIAYASRYYSGMPFEDPVLASLREYVPNNQQPMMGVRELIVLSHLCGGFPAKDQRWKVASAYPNKNDPPVMRLLGYFVAGSTASTASENSVWVVQQWDGFAPLESYAVAQQTSGFGLGRLFGAEQRAVQDRHNMIKAIIKGMIKAVAFLHDASVAHGALSKAVFRLNTFDDKDWMRVAVKVDGLGMATYGGQMPASLTSVFAGEYRERCRLDRQRMGLLVLELVVSSLSREGTMEVTRLERLLTEVYENDVQQFREYIEQESAFEEAVSFIESSGLWDVVELLVEGNMELRSVLEHSFFLPAE
jgi:hypothetical protein